MDRMVKNSAKNVSTTFDCDWMAFGNDPASCSKGLRPTFDFRVNTQVFISVTQIERNIVLPVLSPTSTIAYNIL